MKSDQLRISILAADLAWIPVALAAACGIFGLPWHHTTLRPGELIVYLVCMLLAWVWLSEKLHLDGFRGGWRFPSVVSQLLLGVLLLTTLLLLVGLLSDMQIRSRTLGTFSFLLLVGFLSIRGTTHWIVLRRFRKGHVHRVVILGSDRLANELAIKFNHHPELRCKVAGFLCPNTELPISNLDTAERGNVISTIEITELLLKQQVSELVVAHRSVTHEILDLIALCRKASIAVTLIPQPYELYLSDPKLTDLNGLPLLQIGRLSDFTSAEMGKRLLDLSLSLMVAIMTFPLLLASCIVLRFSTGKAFRWESRIGRHGIPFSMLRLNVDRDPGPGPALAGFLSQMSISELPQLWNVFRGEMSLVGPRPEGPERAEHYSAWQQQRLAARPGMTGLAQVQGLRERHSSEHKTRLDLQYMLRPSLLKDIALLIETMWTLSLRLIKIPEYAIRANSRQTAEARKAIAYSLNHPPFQEIFQNAHRTQSGSD